MYRLISLVLLLWFVGCSGSTNKASSMGAFVLEDRNLSALHSEPILRIKASHPEGAAIVSSYGTAFLTTHKDRLILVTANHVVKDAVEFFFYNDRHERVDIVIGKIVLIPSLDSAVLYPTFIGPTIEPLQSDSMQIGSDCTLVGFPFDGEKVRTNGVVLSSFFETSAMAESGMSGGPVIRDGKVVGVISSIIKTSSTAKVVPQSSVARLSDVLNQLK